MSDELPEADCLTGAPHPRHADTVFGHDRPVAQFMEALETGRMHHGWLLSGPKGVGKATFAWQAAKRLIDGGQGPFMVNPESPAARQVKSLAAPGLSLCRRSWDEKTKRLRSVLGVDDVRRMKSFFTMSSAEGGWRVGIVDSADEMNTAAANALLKLLEEPPARTVFFLIGHQPSLLLPTIRSRCRSLRFDPLTTDDIASALGQASIGTEDLEGVSTLAAGSAGRAVQLMSSDGVELYRLILNMLSTMPGADRQSAMKLAETAAGRQATDQYDMLLDLIPLSLSRLTLMASRGGGVEQGFPGEAEMAARLLPTPTVQQMAAQLVSDVMARAAHGRAVNLDPGQVILDMILSIDTAFRKAA